MTIDASLLHQRTEPATLGERAWVRLLPLEGGGFASLPQALPPRIGGSESMRQVGWAADVAMARLSRLAWQQGGRTPLLRSSFLHLFQERHNPAAGWTPYARGPGDRWEQDPRGDQLYREALEAGLEADDKLSFCRELPPLLHGILLRNEGRNPASCGRLRQIQTWWQANGESRSECPYVPPPPEWIRPLLDSLDQFLDAPLGKPPSLLAALFYFQFVAIQPFEDGNRRIAGILASLLWVKNRVLPYPLLDLSGYFLWTKLDWIYRFLRVIRYGAWEEWIRYYLEGLILECHRASLLLDGGGKRE
ncbi:MAG: Fic family protein [Methylacidiphilaceae bacterium]|nr:Fic family protein [Candidatus Methylacidiphilaceae bacterium]